MSSVEGEKKEFFLLIKEMRKLNAPLSKKDFFYVATHDGEKKTHRVSKASCVLNWKGVQVPSAYEKEKKSKASLRFTVRSHTQSGTQNGNKHNT